MSKTFHEKILRKSTKISKSVFPRLFCFIAFGGLLSDGSSKALQKTFYQKKSCRKVLQKIRPNNPKPIFSRNFFYHVFGRFSTRGVQKHDKINIETNNLTLVLFRTLTHPPTTGVPDFFFAGPLGSCNHNHGLVLRYRVAD
jgi:hypothetical protein